MAVIGDAYIEVHADTDRVEKSIGGSFGKAAKTAAGIFAGAFAAQKAFDFVGDALAEATEAAKIGRLTEAVVKSTGGAANVSADQLGKLSEKLSNIAAVDDEVIQGAGNVLLTFTKVRNEVGKGNNIFDQATAAALDMSAALGTDLQGATMLMGKALNDPIKGLTALTRSGVGFTEQQKEQVKAMVAAGDTLGAQKIILGELQTQFGGAAAAASDPMQRLGIVVGNLKERLGTSLLPIVEKVATYLGNNLPGFLDGAMGAFDTLGEVIGNVVTALQPVGEAIRQVFDVIVNRDFTGGPFAEDSPFISGLFTFRDALVNSVIPAVQSFVGWVGDNLQPILMTLGGILLVAAGPIALLAAGFTYAYTESEGFRTVVQEVVAWFSETAIPAISAFAQHIGDSFADAVAWTRENWAQISEAVQHYINFVKGYIETVIAAIRIAWQMWGDDLVRIIGTVWNGIRETVENAVRIVQGVIQTVMALINGDWGKAWDGIKQIVGAVWDQIGNVVSTAFGIVRGLFTAFGSTVNAVWQAAWDGIKSVAKGAIDGAVGFVTGLPGRITGAIGGVASAAAGIGKAMLEGIGRGLSNAGGFVTDFAASIGRAIKGVVNGMIDRLNDAIPDSLGAGPFKVNFPNNPIPHLARGGTALAGRMHLVGEEGPELFVPGVTGTVISNDRLFGLGGAALIGAVRTVAVGVYQIVEELFDRINVAVTVASTDLGGVVGNLGGMLADAASSFDSFGDSVKNLAGSVADAVDDLESAISSALSSLQEAAQDAAQQANQPGTRPGEATFSIQPVTNGANSYEGSQVRVNPDTQIMLPNGEWISAGLVGGMVNPDTVIRLPNGGTMNAGLVPQVNIAMIDTPSLLTRLNIGAAVGDAMFHATRLRPVL